jgi:hypothetical protein
VGNLTQTILVGGPEQSFIYPINIGLILVAGLIVGSAVVFYEEIKNFGKK